MVHIDPLQPSLDNQESRRSHAIQIFALQTGYTKRLTRGRALTGFEIVWLTPLGYETHMTHGTEDWRKEGKLEGLLADSCGCANWITPVVIHGSCDETHGPTNGSIELWTHSIFFHSDNSVQRINGK